MAEQVTVTAESPLLETSKADRGTVIDSHRIAELPLQSRSPMALTVLVAGVNYNAQAIYLRPFDNGALADWSMNGGQNRNNEFLLDGAPNNANQGGNNIAYVPPADAVQEFKVADQLLRRAVRPHGRRRRQHVAQVGHQLVPRRRLRVLPPQVARRQLVPAQCARRRPRSITISISTGSSVDGPIKIPGLYNGTNKTFFMFNGEKYREGTPAAQFSTRADRGDEARRLQQPRRRAGHV